MLHIPVGCSFYFYKCLNRWQTEDMQSQDSACFKESALHRSVFKLWALRTHCIRTWVLLVHSSLVLDLFHLLLGEWSSKTLGGDQHPLWGLPTKSAVEPLELGLKLADFTGFQHSPLPQLYQRLLSSMHQSLLYAFTSFLGFFKR